MKLKYKDSIITFDIETTSMEVPDNEKKSRTNKHKTKKYAFMYIGAIYNNGVIFKYRKWKDIVNYFDKLSSLCKDDERYVCYVHNLSFEFQFMKDWFKLEDVFCRKAHNVIRCRYKNIEFRCSLALANCKLEKLAKNEHLGVKKLVGDLDYSLIRHYNTPLTEQEQKYVDNDVIIVAEYIKKKVKEYGGLENIPMTSTGEVRYLFRKELGKNLKKIHSLVEAYSAPTMECQNLLIDAYSGAYTHANYQIIDQIVYNLGCRDISSSYPFQMVARKFPTIWFKIKESYYEDIYSLFEKYPPSEYASVFTASFTNIRSKHVHSILSQHKCSQLDTYASIDNGRVNSADYLTISLTETDLLNVFDFYDFDEITLENVWVSKKEYLPKEIVAIILKLFKQKTELKDIEEEEENYMRSKNRINGVYGTAVFNLLDSGVYFDEISNMNFFKEEKTFSDFKKYTSNPNQYLWYSIGVWVTSYAKRQILEPIKKMSENAKYSDTDSVKFTSVKRYDKMWEHLNAKVKTEFYNAMKYHKFSPVDYTFIDKHGKHHFMGIFDEEKPYKRFKALGSKRYLVEYYDGEMKSTVAGAPKNLWEHLGTTNDEKFANFKNNFKLENCKLTHTYCEGKELRIVEDYLGNKAIVDIRSGVCLTPADFSMNLSEQFFEFLLGKITFTDKDIYKYFIGQQKFKK